MIDVESVTVRFGDHTALHEAHFTVDDGEFVCLVGRNGSGKTTLLRLLAGLSEPSAGRVRIAGHAATNLAARTVRGFVQAEPPLYDYLTVREQLSFICRLHGAPLATALERLEHTVLADRHDALVRELSLGMRKQLGLVAATLHDPALVLMDEPANALDATAVTTLRETVRDWHAQKRTVVLCTHDLAWADDLADRLLVLQHGCVVHDVRLADETVTTALRRLGATDALTRPEPTTAESTP
ncbi:ABC transporter ATP-binding protein [Streptomyces natalensis]|uniref:ABC transporter ATP-binding protein n=1 Tax=Streptomyces natalensis TaxID=68242 RepID=UPI00068F1EE2|nr:ABC transporter ATP-binding protein [Streptomyces natalensis]